MIRVCISWIVNFCANQINVGFAVLFHFARMDAKRTSTSGCWCHVDGHMNIAIYYCNAPANNLYRRRLYLSRLCQNVRSKWINLKKNRWLPHDSHELGFGAIIVFQIQINNIKIVSELKWPLIDSWTFRFSIRRQTVLFVQYIHSSNRSAFNFWALNTLSIDACYKKPTFRTTMCSVLGNFRSRINSIRTIIEHWFLHIVDVLYETPPKMK